VEEAQEAQGDAVARARDAQTALETEMAGRKVSDVIRHRDGVAVPRQWRARRVRWLRLTGLAGRRGVLRRRRPGRTRRSRSRRRWRPSSRLR
jgi:hypothetical protein